jgi:hypothetical protein
MNDLRVIVRPRTRALQVSLLLGPTQIEEHPGRLNIESLGLQVRVLILDGEAWLLHTQPLTEPDWLRKVKHVLFVVGKTRNAAMLLPPRFH